ncbi:MAG: hypothetical protein ACH350_06220 [Parachlamydiaceae bacterium]
MGYENESEKLEKNMHPDTTDPIHSFYLQISKLPDLNRHGLPDCLKGIQITVSLIIDQFHEQKHHVLELFDQWIKPIAQDFFSQLYHDIEQLKMRLDQKLTHVDQVSPSEWQIEAEEWGEWYSKWSDQKKIIKKVLDAVAEKTDHLINKDIQIIREYQTQSLSHVSQQTDTFKSLEERLSNAIEEPLKQLMGLRIQAKKHTSLQQASEWVANLQEKRETCFDQLLMKIDHVMKDAVNLEDIQDGSVFLEVEGEILFMEQELHHIHEDLIHLDLIEESDKQFLLARLDGLCEHVADLAEHSYPCSLQSKIDELKKEIFSAMTRLER